MSATKIFYLEDEVFLAKIIKESLEQRGYEVTLVRDGRLAEAAFLDAQPDICLLDVMLPHRDGFEIGAAIKTLAPAVPILFLTAKDQTEDVLKGFSVGANDYIRKPCSLEELIVRLENLLALTQQVANPQRGLSEQIALGRFTFFTHQHRLQYQSEPSITLSYKEVELLKLLVQHQNQTVERKVILNKIWGDDSFFNSRSLDVYMTKLRGYFKREERVKILTLRGVGYHFTVA
jgi:DNA-binding response OmpR family regulator